MKIEAKLTFNMIRKNIKRTIFTIISIILCSLLIFSIMLLISSIRNGIDKNMNIKYNDYHIIIKNLDFNSFNKIKDKEYIDKIYFQGDKDKQLIEFKQPYTDLNKQNNINVYIKFKDIKKVCNYSTDIIQTLDSPTGKIQNYEDKYEFNQKLLTVYGLIDVEIIQENFSPICRVRVNYSYVIDILILVIIIAFSILCITILYNAFLITINERQREYAILNSIGATEGQILIMIFLECIVIAITGIIFGGLLAFLCSTIILEILNTILVDTGYSFMLIFDAKYIALSLLIILFNTFIAAIIPSIKASTTSIIQGIKNNKQINCKNKNTLLEKALPIEGKIAIKNIRRNRNKYKIITILLIVCMTSFIAVSTYINYEKVTADLVNKYDVDAQLNIDSKLNIDYKSIFNDYEVKYKDKIEYIEYKKTGLEFLVEPNDSLLLNTQITTYEDGKRSIPMGVIGLDDTTYKNYLNELNANYGDIIVYNIITDINVKEALTYSYYPALQTKKNLKLSIIATYKDSENDKFEYAKLDTELLDGRFILTDNLLEGFNEIKTTYLAPTIFVNMDTYQKIEKKINNYIPKDECKILKWIIGDSNTQSIKIKCKNIVGFSNYLKNIMNQQNIKIDVEYYSLDNQEKIIYINIVQLILRTILISIILIGIISTINIINASLCERKQDFRILHSLGATKGNINKILIYECIYIYMKAIVISIILSIPILYWIIKYMENLVILDKLLIPFASIGIFASIILLISLFITLCSARSIKNE